MTIIDKNDKTLKFLRGRFSYLFFFRLLPFTHTHTNEKDNLSLWELRILYRKLARNQTAIEYEEEYQSHMV